jgi:EPS-associated MarR family transcriptional regulator
MIEQNPSEEILAIIKEIETDPSATQRDLSQKVGISLGKTNYLLKELIKKGFIRVCHFSTHRGRLKKVTYILTTKGFEQKIRLIKHFLKLKELEYANLQREWRILKNGLRKKQ